MAKVKTSLHAHDDNSFAVHSEPSGTPLGLVVLGLDECSWYASWIDVDEGGPDTGDVRATRREAIDDLLAAAAAGRVEIIICS